MVLNVCQSVLHNRHDAEDVLQATFLVLARKAASIRHREAVGGWLWEVAYRLARKEQQRIARRHRHDPRTTETTMTDPLLDMTLRELHQVMLEELHRLPEKYRLPLVLCYLEGRTQTEAARQLSWPKEMFRVRLNRGRTLLRTRLTRRGLALTAGLFASALSAGPTPAALPTVQVETIAKAVVADYALRRGIPVKFRVLDKRTGRPVRGQIQYDIAQENPLWAEAAFGPNTIPSREFMHIRSTDQDGYVRFVAYPGPCVIYGFAGRENEHFLRAKLDPADEAKGYLPLGKGDPANRFLGLSHGYRRIDYPEDAKEQTFDILFDSGATLKGVVVGPDSQPVKGAVAYGLTFDRTTQPQPPENAILPNDTFLARGLDPDIACTLSFVQRERKLIGYVVVHGNERQPVTVGLRQWGELTGRLVDDAGKPLANVRVSLKHPDLPQPGMRPWDEAVRIDLDGRFRVEGLLPGLDHELILAHSNKKDIVLSAGEALTKLKAGEGKVKDLGNVVVKAAPAQKSEK
jgi:RNA polymerase sigma factor (sigma-70 family)